MKLSSAYAKEDGDLELKMTVLNINPGSNADIMEKCRTLKEYSIYVDRVRTHAKTVPIEEAVQRSVDECIEEGILAEFLKVQKSEVISMSIFEYNKEIELKKIRRAELLHANGKHSKHLLTKRRYLFYNNCRFTS